MTKDIMDLDQILSANSAFYEYFRTSNFEAMADLWLEDDSVLVVHPNWPAIDGYEDVLDSWFRIMIEGVPPQVYPEDPTVVRTGNLAIVYCKENLGQSETIATNTFRKIDNKWKLIQHLASCLPESE